MGRKPAVTTKTERAYLSDSINTSVGEGELPPENTNPAPEGAELQHANRNPSGRVERQPKILANSGYVSTSRKQKQTVSVSVRRSVRLQGTAMPTHNQDIERVINEIALSDSEKEEDEPPAYEETKQPDPTVGNKSLEDKITYLIQLLEEQRDRSSPGENPSLSYARYKSLYIDSQKKIGALSEENRQLTTKLDVALGKLEAYEKGARAPLEVLEKFKDFLFFSNPTRVTERAENVSAQTIHDAFTSQDADWEAKTSSPKRRKLDKGRKKN